MSYNVDDWIADLESGEFKQCAGRLTNGEGFCCLGLLEHRLGRLTDEGRDIETASYLSPPANVADLIGLPKNDYTLTQVLAGGARVFDPQILIRDGEKLYATSANDTGKTFKEIAAGIRRARERGWY